jgi:hypothetical protein
MVLEANRLPTIVQEFLKEAATLHTLIQTATSEIITEIKGMLYEQQSKLYSRSSFTSFLLIRHQFPDGLVRKSWTSRANTIIV